MKFNSCIKAGRGLIIAVFALMSLSATVYHDEVSAAGGGKSSENSSGNSGRDSAGSADRSGDGASSSRDKNASDKSKAARAAQDDSYQKWLSELLKE